VISSVREMHDSAEPSRSGSGLRSKLGPLAWFGLLIAALSVAFAIFGHAGIGTSAAVGGNTTDPASVLFLIEMMIGLALGDLLICAGIASYTIKVSRNQSTASPVWGPAIFSSIPGASALFLGIMGAGLLLIGSIAPLSFFCFSHGPGSCEFSTGLLVIPRDLVSSGTVIMLVAAAVFSIQAFRFSRGRSGPSRRADQPS
jgi:hypothetical protein